MSRERALRQIKVDDCKSCPFKHLTNDHNVFFYACNHPYGKHGREDVLWYRTGEFKGVPLWCPLDCMITIDEFYKRRQTNE